jgi:tyrosinase
LFDIEGQLGYTYSPGSLEGPLQLGALQVGHSTKVIRVSGINRGAIGGSFLICVYAKIEGVRQLVGMEPVFSRWHVQGCANCQTHLEAKAYVGMQGFREESLKSLKDEDYDVEIHTRREGVIKASPPSPLATFTKRPFLFSVR